MAVVRVITDIEVDGEVTKTQLNKVAKAAKEHADGVLAEMYFSKTDRGTRGRAHVHKSNEDHSCRSCIRLAQDEIS